MTLFHKCFIEWDLALSIQSQTPFLPMNETYLFVYKQVYICYFLLDSLVCRQHIIPKELQVKYFGMH